MPTTTTTTYEPGSPEAQAAAVRRPSPWLTPLRVTSVLLGVSVVSLGVISVVTQFATRVHTESLTVQEQIRSLSVDVRAGDVVVRDGSPGSPVEIEVQTRSALQEANWAHSIQDGALTLTGTCSGGWPIDNCSVSYTVVVPADADIDVKLHTNSGDQRVGGVSGAADLSTGSGDIDITSAEGALKARTGSGDIRATLISSPTAELRTGSGDIEAELLALTTSAGLRTGSGDIQAGFKVAPTAVTAKTGSGDLRMFVPDDGAAYDVVGKTGSGDRKIEVPTGSAEHRIEANTGSGDVLIGIR